MPSLNTTQRSDNTWRIRAQTTLTFETANGTIVYGTEG